MQGLDELRLATRHSVEFFVAASTDVLTEVKRLTRASGALNAALVEDAVAEAAFEEGEGDDLEADDGISEAPLVRLVNSIIFQAAEEGASDVHFEPQEDALVVRFRDRRRPSRRAADPHPPDRRRHDPPQGSREARHRREAEPSGRPHHAQRRRRRPHARHPRRHAADGRRRVSDDAPPRQVAERADAQELGLSDEMRDQLAGIVSRPTGALLVTGPTGSGKSTTLYAALAAISRPEINIITVEDPVEYRLAGINQVQINVRAGLTFARALRSILRSDPDVVMVGEIRDGETAKISIEAALTGHLVLSTLHTNDAPGAITRLNEMGVEPFITGAAVSAVLAQRLARKLCSHCAEPYTPSQQELLAPACGRRLRRQTGAAACSTAHADAHAAPRPATAAASASSSSWR